MNDKSTRKLIFCLIIAAIFTTLAIISVAQTYGDAQTYSDCSDTLTNHLADIQQNVPERTADINSILDTINASKPIPTNTYYEELKAIGFYPQERRLEAVIDIKRQGGYNAFEFVTFWVDWNNDTRYTDNEMVGIVNVYVSNPGSVLLPLEYAVYRDVAPPPNLKEGVRKVKATLSFYNPVFNPYTTPVFGNSIEANIRFDPIR